jgi:hypothetical protein
MRLMMVVFHHTHRREADLAHMRMRMMMMMLLVVREEQLHHGTLLRLLGTSC